MKRPASTTRLRAISLVIAFFVHPLWAGAQCSVTNTVAVPAPSPTSPYNRVYKTLNGPFLCNRVASMNASLCAPGPAAVLRTRLTASADTTATSPSCQFFCTGGCGAITIDSTDGLPVELMGFEIEGLAPREAGPEPDRRTARHRGVGSRVER